MEKVGENLREKVLVVADRLSHPALLSTLFSEKGYAITTLGDSGRAPDALVRESPDLVLIDPALARTEGMELCFQLKTNDFTSHIPILILGTNSLGAERLQWFTSGADVCLDSPYDPRELMARVQSLIRRTVVYDTITQLPTGAYLHQQLDAWLANNVQTAVIYADIDHYQAHVDQYGSEAGNRVIMRLAKLIVDALPYGTVTPAHLGNDDFMAMLKPDASRTVAQTLVDQFRAIRSEFYPDGVVPTQPLSLSVALVTNEHRVLFNYMQVSNLLSNTMRRIKSRGGDHWAE